MNLPELNLPPYPFQLSRSGDKLYVFDEIRKKRLVLNPEEWVRQHFVQYLVNQKKYPKGLIRLEGGFTLNSLQKRTDILVYDREGAARILVECKAPAVRITQDVLDQALRYHIRHRVEYIVLSNGLDHYYFRNDGQGALVQLDDLPENGQAS